VAHAEVIHTSSVEAVGCKSIGLTCHSRHLAQAQATGGVLRTPFTVVSGTAFGRLRLGA